MHLFNLFGPNELIKSITAEDWNSVKTICECHPSQAKSWSTRRGFFDGVTDSHVLPLHQAVALRPPIHALDALIQAHPQGVLCKETSFKRLAIHIALQSSDSCEVVRLLLSYAPDSAAQRDVLERVPLHYACSNGASLETIIALLSAFPGGAAIRDLHGWLPLHVACYYGAPLQVIEKLLEAYPDAVGKRTEKGSVPLKLLKKINTKDKDKIETVLTHEMAHYIPVPNAHGDNSWRPGEPQKGHSIRSSVVYKTEDLPAGAHNPANMRRRRHHHNAISA